MGEAKHTSGPWKIQYGGLSDADQGFSIVSSIVPGTVAECYPPVADLERRKRLLADAHLISASPDLLAALKLCMEWMPRAEVRSWPPGFQLRVNAMALGKAAIEKAEGR
jgi:hypothetical protein